MRSAVLLLAFCLVLAVPVAAAGPEVPPEKLPSCGTVLGEAKCEQIREDVRDLLTCTCPPW